MSRAGYEEAFGPVGRRARRLLRKLKWFAKPLLGRPRTLLVELRWRLGDEIMAMPVFEGLRAHYPDARITVWSNFPELFENHPFIDAMNTAPSCVDRYLLLRGAPRNVYRLEHHCRTARIALPTARPRLYYEDWAAPQLAELPTGTGPLIAIATQSTWSTKRWRTERWRALGERLQDRGARIVELGATGEGLGVGCSLLGRTTVREAACVLHHADLLVSCDSGLMHLALAANTPVVALFGATDPGILVRGEPKFQPICSQLDCHGFWNRADGTPDPEHCPLHHECCLDDIGVDAVLQAIETRGLLR